MSRLLNWLGTLAYVIVMSLVHLHARTLGRRRIKPARTPCPYCANPDRDSVFEYYGGCQYDVEAHHGADPPCVCDGYGSKRQLARLGLRR